MSLERLRVARLREICRKLCSREIWERRALWAVFGCFTLASTPAWRRRLLRYSVACVVLLNLVVIGEWHATSALLPATGLHDYDPPQSTHIYSANGHLVAQLYHQRRTVVSLEQVPAHVTRAFLAAEDANFYEHGGIDYIGIVRAFLKNLRPGARRQGASTITQQTVKALVVGTERSYSRKLKEALLARRLELIMSKDEILHIYLNEIYFGDGAHGVEEASHTYFGKPVEALTVAEGATLAGIPKRPSRYNPRAHPEEARRRRDYVLEQMQRQGWLTRDEVAAAVRGPVELAPPSPYLDVAPHYVEHVRRLLVERFGEELVYKGGLDVHTGLDVGLQDSGHQHVRHGLDAVHARLKPGRRPEGALVAIDPHTREVRALVGGYDLGANGFNRATQASRQPGSAFKPIVYAAGLATRKITPASQCADAPLVVYDQETGESWKPDNYNAQQYSGYISHRSALMRSINTCSIRIADRVGVESIIEMAHALGIESALPEDLTIALGSGDVSPLELASAYSTIAAGGRAADPIFIRRVVNPEGTLLHLASSGTRPAIEPAVAFVLTSMLQSVVDGGTGSRARALGRDIAGKTGTSNESRNLWFSGFSPDLVTTVWVGYDDNAPVGGLTGGSGALPIWVDFMADALAGTPKRSFVAPPGVRFVQIDPETGALASPGAGLTEVFVAGTEPDENTGAVQSLFLVDESDVAPVGGT
jgi:penicillin-binding protein 1A